LPFLATLVVCAALYVAAGLRYDNFFSPQVAINLVGDNAFLGIAAIGMTFVILSGGIDLSVGTAVGMYVRLHRRHGREPRLAPAAAISVALLGGTVVGYVHGLLIGLRDQPFLVTLGGLFFYRGVGLLISRESISLTHPRYVRLSEFTGTGGWHLRAARGARVPLSIVAASYVAFFRPIGRAVYAVWRNEQSALLMGVPVGAREDGRIRFQWLLRRAGRRRGVGLHVVRAALTGGGLELDAIAAVVIGGTLLSGGVGGPVGTLLGILVFGIIQTAISFEGSLSSWWARIVVGLLLLAFISLQTFCNRRRTTHDHPSSLSDRPLVVFIAAIASLPVSLARAADKIVVGFAQVGAESAWRTANTKSIKDEAEKRGIELKFADAQQKQENQIKAVRAFIAQRVDVIVLAPVVEAGFEPVLREAKRAKIPVILSDRRAKVSDDSLYVTFIGSDFVEEGRKAAKFLIDKTGGKATIAELQGTPAARRRTTGKRGSPR
jgi:simple sugar transport system permease protein